MDLVWQAEDSLREKKLENDLGDLLKTLVAFANSVAPDDTAQIFIGEKDDGTVQGVTNSDNIQKSVKKEADKIYPPIRYKTDVYEREGKHCVRVDIFHNGQAPHFGGASWVRQGSVTVSATDVLYQQMVEQRQSKMHRLLEWQKKELTLTVQGSKTGPFLPDIRAMAALEWSVGQHSATLDTINAHWVTFNVYFNRGPSVRRSEPMEKILLSWDDDNQRPKVIVLNWS